MKHNFTCVELTHATIAGSRLRLRGKKYRKQAIIVMLSVLPIPGAYLRELKRAVAGGVNDTLVWVLVGACLTHRYKQAACCSYMA
jgi:hypothetical protein